MAANVPQWFRAAVSALAYSVGRKHGLPLGPPFLSPYNDVADFIIRQWQQLPDYLRVPMAGLTLTYDLLSVLKTGRRFHKHQPAMREQMLSGSACSQLGPERDLVRYYESLATLALFSRGEPATESASGVLNSASGICDLNQPFEFAVIGSGPSGAITACLLAEAGRKVVLIEEGQHFAPDAPTPFSHREMLCKYRNGGQTVALGADKISYVEGRCVGGGSEINSGLYHRPPEELLAGWRQDFAVDDLSASVLEPCFEKNEHELSVSPLPGAPPDASKRLQAGAERLGWKALEVPRWFRYLPEGGGLRQTMTRTFIPRFLAAGGQMLTNARAARLARSGTAWTVQSFLNGRPRLENVRAEHVVLCAGAVQTPCLLRRSGITQNVGNTLALHPTIKVTARFAERVNSAEMGVPVHQVKEFSPRLSFGCSISSMPYVALGLQGHKLDEPLSRDAWAHMANYYAMVTPTGRGSVRPITGFRDPLVRYALSGDDRHNLADGVRKLGQLLLEAGATSLFLSARGATPIRSTQDLNHIPEAFARGVAHLMTIHLFSSCPMGEDRTRCATNSFGRVHGVPGLSIHDGSILCGPPGVNPQGTIMALARRNTMRLLGKA